MDNNKNLGGHMKFIYLSLILIISVSSNSLSYSQTLVNKFELVETFQYETTNGRGGSSVMGWTADDGTEYALMGVYEGIAIVNASTLDSITVVEGPRKSEKTGAEN